VDTGTERKQVADVATFAAAPTHTQQVGEGTTVREVLQLRHYVLPIFILATAAVSERHRRQRDCEWVDRAQILAFDGPVGVLLRVKGIHQVLLEAAVDFIRRCLLSVLQDTWETGLEEAHRQAAAVGGGGAPLVGVLQQHFLGQLGRDRRGGEGGALVLAGVEPRVAVHQLRRAGLQVKRCGLVARGGEDCGGRHGGGEVVVVLPVLFFLSGGGGVVDAAQDLLQADRHHRAAVLDGLVVEQRAVQHRHLVPHRGDTVQEGSAVVAQHRQVALAPADAPHRNTYRAAKLLTQGLKKRRGQAGSAADVLCDYFNCRQVIATLREVATVVHHALQVVRGQGVIRAAADQSLVKRVVVLPAGPLGKLANGLGVQLRLLGKVWSVIRKTDAGLYLILQCTFKKSVQNCAPLLLSIVVGNFVDVWLLEWIGSVN